MCTQKKKCLIFYAKFTHYISYLPEYAIILQTLKKKGFKKECSL